MFFASMRITPLHYFSFWTGDKESGAPSLPPGVRMNGYVKLFVFQHAQSLFFQILRCGNNVFLCKNGTDDGDAAEDVYKRQTGVRGNLRLHRLRAIRASFRKAECTA